MISLLRFIILLIIFILLLPLLVVCLILGIIQMFTNSNINAFSWYMTKVFEPAEEFII